MDSFCLTPLWSSADVTVKLRVTGELLLVSSRELCCGKLACRVVAASTPLLLYSHVESHPGEWDTISCVPRSVDKQVLIMCVAFRNGIFPAVCYSSWKGSGYLIIRVIKARARKFGKQNCSGFIMISILSNFQLKTTFTIC